MKRLVEVLNCLDKWIDQIPPQDDTKQRYGNKSFTTWQKKLEDESECLVRDLLSDEYKEHAKELSAYLNGEWSAVHSVKYSIYTLEVYRYQ